MYLVVLVETFFFFFSAVGDIRFCGRESYCRAVKVLAYSHVVIAIADRIRQKQGLNIHLRQLCRTKAGSYSYSLIWKVGLIPRYRVQYSVRSIYKHCWVDASVFPSV